VLHADLEVDQPWIWTGKSVWEASRYDLLDPDLFGLPGWILTL
jgi:hypothetical protein